MKFKNSLLFILASAALSLTTNLVHAQPVFTSGHGDIGVGYDEINDEFEPHWHLGSGAIVGGSPLAMEDEYSPGALVAETSATRSSPSGLSSVIGVADGTTIYSMGSSTYPPNVGFAAEELDPSDWTGDITITLTDWTLPSATAEFALYTTNLAGTSTVDRLFSTFNSSPTLFSNSLPLSPGDHSHFDWGFTELGTYEFEFTWSGTHTSDMGISTLGTFEVNVVPEPSTVTLLGLGLASALIMRRKRN